MEIKKIVNYTLELTEYELELLYKSLQLLLKSTLIKNDVNYTRITSRDIDKLETLCTDLFTVIEN